MKSATYVDIESFPPVTFAPQESASNPEQHSGFFLIDSEMPAAGKCDEIAQALLEYNKIVVEGPTGSGKTTQIAVALAELGYRVLISQPRILAARSVCDYVRKQLGPHIGEDEAHKFVGYSTEPESDYDPDNRITFYTDGKLRRILAGGGLEDDKVVVIVDEIHEMTVDTELLAATTLQSNIKTIYASATLDTDRIRAYVQESTRQDVVPLISIEGRLHGIEDRKGGLMSEEVAFYGDEGMVVLGFVDTKQDVDRMISIVRGKMKNRNVAILPLHGEQTPEEQRRVFMDYPEGKIIIATSIAETSITIPDVDVVVDGGRHRTSGISDYNERQLPLEQITKDKSDQRRGRCGRTKDGIYVMAHQDGRDFTNWDSLESYSRTALSRSHLAAAIGSFIGARFSFNDLDLYSTVDEEQENGGNALLIRLGALGIDGSETEIGAQMAELPLDPSYSRMLVESRKYPKEVQLQLAAAIASTVDTGILDSNITMHQVMELTDDIYDSVFLTNLAIYIESMSYDDKDLKKLGIVAKKIHKARSKIQSLARRLGLDEVELTTPTGEQRELIRRCIIAGSEDIFVSTNRYKAKDARGAMLKIGPLNRTRVSHKQPFLGQKLMIQSPSGSYRAIGLGTTPVEAEDLLENAPHRCDLNPRTIVIDDSGKILGVYELIFDGVPTSTSIKRELGTSDAEIDILVDYILYEPRAAKINDRIREIQNIVDLAYQVSLKATWEVALDDIIESIKQRLYTSLFNASDSAESLMGKVPNIRLTEYFSNEELSSALSNAPDHIKLGKKIARVSYANGVAKIAVPNHASLPDYGELEEAFGSRLVLLRVPRLGRRYMSLGDIHKKDAAPTRHERRSRYNPGGASIRNAPSYPGITVATESRRS